jgi:hypothetical protein
MRGEKLGANLPLFWNNDGKDRPKGQICPLAKKRFSRVWLAQLIQTPELLRPKAAIVSRVARMHVIMGLGLMPLLVGVTNFMFSEKALLIFGKKFVKLC